MKLPIITFLILLLINTTLLAQDITPSAEQFINTLNEKLKQKTIFTWQDEERFNWYFVPRERKGITFYDLDAKQRAAAMNLLKASISEQGYKKATAIMQMEIILHDLEGRAESDHYRDPLNYHFSVFGTPSRTTPWGWRLEGHHLSLNFACVNGVIESSTPTFFGSNPGIVPSGAEKGKQLLKLETDLGLSLVNVLTPDQLKVAVIDETAPAEIITGNSRKAQPPAPQGLCYTAMNDMQKKIFMQLLEVYVKNYVFGFSSKLMNKIKAAGIDNLYFAWAGGRKAGVGTYYRIQGPMLLIEYDNTQNNANHVHTVVRDLTNDFAEDILREHYRKEHGR